MGGYTKLFSDIVESSIWDQDSDTCKVWITLLALSDQDGYVRGSAGWLADKSRVKLESCLFALKSFAGPDHRSRTPDNDGRRIEELEDGWLILNYIDFRNRLSTDAAASSSRERVRRHREKKRQEALLRNACYVTPPGPASASVSVSVTDRESEGKGLDAPLADELPVLTPEQSKHTAELFAYALERFGLTPLDINCNRIRGNIAELLMRGYTHDQIETVLAWAKSPKARTGTPQSAPSATDPVKFGQWLTTMENHQRENEQEAKRRNR